MHASNAICMLEPLNRLRLGFLRTDSVRLLISRLEAIPTHFASNKIVVYSPSLGPSTIQ